MHASKVADPNGNVGGVALLDVKGALNLVGRSVNWLQRRQR